MSRAPRRIALTIGNDNYYNLRSLRNAASDAGAIAKIMRKAGFTTTARTNLSRLELGRAVGLFVNQLRDGGVGVFWFSGHGMQLQNKNLLLPVDARYNSGFGMNEEGVFLDHLLERATEVRAKTVIAFVDACRDNPFGHGMTRSAGPAPAGLQPPASVPSGFMVIYSAGSNQVALDNLGPDDTHPHGLFTRELLPLLTQPGCGIDQAVRQAREQVRTKALAAGFQQVPSIYDQLDGCFYLVPPTLGGSTNGNNLDASAHAGIIASVNLPKKLAKSPKKQADDKFSVIRGRDGTPEMIAQCIALDAMCFAEETCASYERCLEWWEHCPDNYLFLLDNDTQDIVGYINAMAIDRAMADAIRAGKIIDPAIECENIYSMDLPGIYDLFICSMVIHRDFRGPPATRALTMAFMARLAELAREDIFIRWLLADAFTIQGRQLCSHLGMQQICTSEHGSQVYSMTMLPPSFMAVTESQRKLHLAYTRKHNALLQFCSSFC